MELFLVRHGESEWNLKHLFQGQHHSKLTKRGKQQAKRVATWIARYCSPDYLISSDLRRAVQTAQVIGKTIHLKPLYTKLLRERSLGSLEGKSNAGFNTVQDHYTESGHKWIPKSAETLKAVKKRAKKAIAILLKSKANCAVVCSHETFNSVLANTLLRRKLQPVPQNHTQVHYFKLNGRGKVISFKLACSIS